MVNYRKLLFLCFLIMLLHPSAHAVTPQYTKADSIKIMKLLADSRHFSPNTDPVLYYARQLKGIPYVAHTLDRNTHEQLVINLRELDCTTYVENVLALSLCARQKRYTFHDFCTILKNLRYEKGKVDYVSRLHYFTSWIEDNEQLGYISKIQSTKPPFTALQKLDIHYMTKNHASYTMLKDHSEHIRGIRQTEQQLTGKTYRYIPKASLKDSPLLRRTIHNGDIIAILTRRKGLDTSHIGIAVWHKDGLHLLNASSVHKKVVEEPMTLFQYMQKHPSQIGIRIARLK
ncbi:N-acetylmuramoyl-L-alanine amidase-like domain-containing protein [Hoylesella marshii]|uniref:N-acetylmuramoyl-L-alanine amidase-like domain-containing protein n=1 Tax=Hoylesella marshii TaxID=189722 RepID=UPI0028D5ADA6|nr:N-acetylmuramoyl-L-alanine amidase-like domain-containing protein [Hoylesella marshii]